jgi:hypothetical protein
MNRFIFLGSVLLVLASCSTTKIARRYNGVKGADQTVPIGLQKTSRIGFYLLVNVYPVFFDPGLEATVDEFTREARRNRGQRVQIVQADETAWWAILPPFSLFITPVSTSVYGEVY